MDGYLSLCYSSKMLSNVGIAKLYRFHVVQIGLTKQSERVFADICIEMRTKWFESIWSLSPSFCGTLHVWVLHFLFANGKHRTTTFFLHRNWIEFGRVVLHIEIFLSPDECEPRDLSHSFIAHAYDFRNCLVQCTLFFVQYFFVRVCNKQ